MVLEHPQALPDGEGAGAVGGVFDADAGQAVAVEGHLLHPVVMSWAVRLHPVVVASAVVGGAVAAGVIGAVVAVPLTAVAWSVHPALRGPDTGPGPVGSGAGGDA
ncbi:hypothetical protein SZN_31559 [Streptomyces zinciresistens K42]|uniref:Integral membrane protein n=1 Tax=Streptomyces zinciresistens K42 TaxID=700597 RepID=G2GLB6_9ACTN|nr:hypothetical protein SZN_31559 [Streptomyces zinciresistens K42]